MFKKLLAFLKDEEYVTLWCGYYGNRAHLHSYEYHKVMTTEIPSDFNRFIRETDYCLDRRVFKLRTIRFTQV